MFLVKGVNRYDCWRYGKWLGALHFFNLNMQGDTIQQSDTHISSGNTLFGLSAGSYLSVKIIESCIVEYVLNVDEPLFALGMNSMNTCLLLLVW